MCVTMEMVKEALDQLRGAVMIVYPMGLPPHDPIKMEFEHREDLSGTQVEARSRIHDSGFRSFQLVFATVGRLF